MIPFLSFKVHIPTQQASFSQDTQIRNRANTEQALFSEATQIRNRPRVNTQLANYAESMTRDNKSRCQYGIAYAMQ